MIDAHVHLEKGDYSVGWIKQFVAYAVKRNIDEIYFLEHTHIFKEWRIMSIRRIGIRKNGNRHVL